MRKTNLILLSFFLALQVVFGLSAKSICGVECQPQVSFLGEVEYLYWWSKDAPLPVPIATSGSFDDPVPGAIGQPGTQVLFGEKSIDNNPGSGFRVSIESALVAQNEYLIEVSGFYLPEKRNKVFSYESSDILGVPFNNVAPFPLPPGHGGWTLVGPGETALLLGSAPQLFTGSITVDSSTELWGAEMNVLFHFLNLPTCRFGVLGGFFYTGLADHLSLNYFSLKSPQGIYLETVLRDRFRTNNEIYVGQIGLCGEWSDEWLFASFVGKVGLGCGVQTVHISGSFIDPVSNLSFSYGAGNSGGIFAQPTNLGSHSQTRFEVISAATFRFGFNVLSDLRFFVGYDILYLSSVLRPGDQIDHMINETQAGPSAGGVPVLSGPPSPSVHMHTTTYWAQGVNVGIEARF